MGRKTERLYATATLNGETALTAAASLHEAILNLAKRGDSEGRLVLFDTLDVAIERRTVDDRTFFADHSKVQSYVSIEVSAEAVKLDAVSETGQAGS